MKNKKKTAGFTLVELIVVIAILGILAGVGTVGYSGYIKKANMAADEQLINGIENAIHLAAYANDLDGSGYVILSNEGDATVVGAGLEDALTVAFGDISSLKLKYADWGNNGLYAGLYDAASVYNSTYYGVADKLMGQVQEITSAAASIVKDLNDGTSAGRDEMIAIFTPDLLIEAADSSLGMTLTESDLKNMNENEFTNLLVFTAAYDVGLKGLNGDDYEVSEASNIISTFAMYNGYAATESGKTVKDASGKTFADRYADFVTAISAADADVDDVKNAYKGLRDATGSYADYSNYMSADGQGKTDAAAFSAMMMGLTGAAAGNGDLKNQLNDPNFFTSGVGKNLFSTYIDSVPSAAGLEEEIMDGLFGALDEVDSNAVAVYYSKNGAAVSVSNSLPVD